MEQGEMTLILSARLRSALVEYGRVGYSVSDVGIRRDDNRKQALVTARRRLAEEVGKIGPLIEQDEELAKAPDKQRELARIFSSMRSALAQHQADWPAVTIDDDPEAYRASSLRVRDKSDAFWTWCKTHLGFQRDRIAP